ncbi:MAG: zf-HC2 domain-containing protein [Propionibacteriaceae bacterium]|nr:zf-HC2 domain-containing protein [Propionibacteriaceae bacterium]
MTDLSQMCSFVMMRINAFLDNELDEETADDVRIHIANCDECINEVEIWTRIRGAIKQAYEPVTAPVSLIEKITARIHDMELDTA